MLGVGLEDDINEERHERVGRLIRLGIAQEACTEISESTQFLGGWNRGAATENHLAAIQHANDLISWCTVRVDFGELWRYMSVGSVQTAFRFDTHLAEPK